MNTALDCRTNSLRINNTAVVPDAMMTAFLSAENYTATDGRLGATSGDKGWCGASADAWLQIDLGIRELY